MNTQVRNKMEDTNSPKKIKKEKEELFASVKDLFS
jgi:hypothetical protein